MAKPWTDEEISYMEDEWGQISIRGIAKKLGKSINAVKIKAFKQGLTDARFMGDGISVCQLAKAGFADYNTLRNWVQNHGFPARKKLFCKTAKILFVRYEDIWKWSKQHQGLINLRNLSENILGAEPEWVKIKRRADISGKTRSTSWINWTPEENQRLIQLVRTFKYSYPELSKLLNRNAHAIKRQLHELKEKARPVRLNNMIKWTPEETKLLIDLAMIGYPLNVIADKVGKSELGVRGKLERMKFDFKTRRVPEDYLNLSDRRLIHE